MFGDDSGTNEGSQVRLRKRMAKNLQANMVEVLLCVDDSGSISDPDFVKLRQAGESCAFQPATTAPVSPG